LENPTGRYEVVDASRPAVGFETVGVKDLTNSFFRRLRWGMDGLGFRV